MKNIVLLVIFILGIVLMQYIQAQSVDDIINKYLKARGGKDKLDAIRSIYMEGQREMMGSKLPVKVTIVRDKLSRTDFELDGNKGYTIVTPEKGLSFIPGRSQKEEVINIDQLSDMQLQLDIAGPLVDYAAKGNKAKLQEKDMINGREAYKIKLTLRDGREIFYFIDTETNLLVQSRQTNITAEGFAPQEIITNYNDYTSFDGIMFPRIISNPSEGIMSGSTTFDTIVINKPVDETKYYT